jgi:hypothetical protein
MSPLLQKFSSQHRHRLEVRVILFLCPFHVLFLAAGFLYLLGQCKKLGQKMDLLGRGQN